MNWIEVHDDDLSNLMSADQLAQMDTFDRLQLQSVIEVCRRSKSIADAGRALFGASRAKRSTVNDSDRLRKFLQRSGLNWDTLIISSWNPLADGWFRGFVCFTWE